MAKVIDFVCGIPDGIKSHSLLNGTIGIISLQSVLKNGSEGLSSTDLRDGSEGGDAEKWGKRDFILCKL